MARTTGLLVVILVPTLGLTSSEKSFVDGPITTALRNGRDIVDSMAYIFRKYSILGEDFNLLMRTAYFDTQFIRLQVKDANTGGIWRISRGNFNHISGILDDGFRTLIDGFLEEQTTGLTWAQVTYSHLDLPLYSGLAAAILFTNGSLPHNFPYPQTMEAQAELWLRITDRENWNKDKFTELAYEMEGAVLPCTGSHDIFFLIDGSKGEDQIQIQKEMTKRLIRDVSTRELNVGIIGYGATTQTIVEFGLVDIRSLDDEIDLGVVPAGPPALNLALKATLGIHGDRHRVFPSTLVIFSLAKSADGVSNIDLLHQRGFKPLLLTIGTKDEIDQDHRKQLEYSAGYKGSVFYLESLSTLQNESKGIAARISGEVCKGNRVVVYDNPIYPVSGYFRKEEKNYYEVKFEKNETSLWISINSTSSWLWGLWTSSSYRYPNVAVCDQHFKEYNLFVVKEIKRDDLLSDTLYFTIGPIQITPWSERRYTFLLTSNNPISTEDPQESTTGRGFSLNKVQKVAYLVFGMSIWAVLVKHLC